MNTRPRILIADDQPDVLEALRLLLKAEKYESESASSPAGIVALLENREFDLVVMDLNYSRDTTSGAEGLELVTRIQAMDNCLPVVAMTAWGSIELAVEAMRRGADDFLEKPFQPDVLRNRLQSASLSTGSFPASSFMSLPGCHEGVMTV